MILRAIIAFFPLAICILMVVLVYQILPAQTLTRQVGVPPGQGIPVNKMQIHQRSSQYDVPPKFISGAAPIYPISRLRNRESGYADVAFTVDDTGHTRDFRVLKTTYLYFANHAILAVQNWRFKPATKNGHKVPCRLHIPFTYQCD